MWDQYNLPSKENDVLWHNNTKILKEVSLKYGNS